MPLIFAGTSQNVVLPIGSKIVAVIGSGEGVANIGAGAPVGQKANSIPFGPQATTIGPFSTQVTVGIYSARGMAYSITADNQQQLLSQGLTGGYEANLPDGTGIFVGKGTAGAVIAAIAMMVNAEVRGDSLSFGFGLTDPTALFGQLLANRFQSYGRWLNHGVSSSGTFTQFNYMVGNVAGASGGLRPLQTDPPVTAYLAMYNEMRSGNTAPRLDAARGMLMATSLLCLSKWSALRQYFNGGAGGTFFGAPVGSLALGGSWGITTIGVNNEYRGVNATTNGNTHTSIVNGNVIYVVYDRNKVNTGGTFSVTVDGAVVIPSVSCSGAGLLAESQTDEPLTSTAAIGYPTVLRIPVLPGRHTVVLTVTSATNAANFVQIEFVAGNSDMYGGRTLLMGLCPKMNAAGYLASPAAYASQAIGDAAVAQYQAIQMDVVAQLVADGFDARIADTNAFVDPTVAGTVLPDNLHWDTLGHSGMAKAYSVAWETGPEQQLSGGGAAIQTPAVPASGTWVKNVTGYTIEVRATGGTLTAIDFSRDGGTTAINYAGGTPGGVTLNPGDWYRLTYTVAPVIQYVFR